MINQVFNLLGSIVILAMVSTALSSKSNTSGVVTGFFNGFSSSIKAARA